MMNHCVGNNNNGEVYVSDEESGGYDSSHVDNV